MIYNIWTKLDLGQILNIKYLGLNYIWAKYFINGFGLLNYSWTLIIFLVRLE